MKLLLTVLLFTALTAQAADIDTELNNAYKTAYSATKDPQSLKTAQNAWLKFIKLDCEALPVYGFGGNDTQQLKIYFEDCINDYKISRTKYLKSFTD